MEPFFWLRFYYTMNLGRDGVSYKVAEKVLKKHFEMNVRTSSITAHF